jgi:hypothetical protein
VKKIQLGWNRVALHKMIVKLVLQGINVKVQSQRFVPKGSTVRLGKARSCVMNLPIMIKKVRSMRRGVSRVQRAIFAMTWV